MFNLILKKKNKPDRNFCSDFGEILSFVGFAVSIYTVAPSSCDMELHDVSFSLSLPVLFRRKKTFSAVGFGHERIPFLSTQQND